MTMGRCYIGSPIYKLIRWATVCTSSDVLAKASNPSCSPHSIFLLLVWRVGSMRARRPRAFGYLRAHMAFSRRRTQIYPCFPFLFLSQPSIFTLSQIHPWWPDTAHWRPLERLDWVRGAPKQPRAMQAIESLDKIRVPKDIFPDFFPQNWRAAQVHSVTIVSIQEDPYRIHLNPSSPSPRFPVCRCGSQVSFPSSVVDHERADLRRRSTGNLGKAKIGGLRKVGKKSAKERLRFP